AHGIQSSASNKENINNVGTTMGPNPIGNTLGKRVAYPVVVNYVRNTWGKYELVKSMLNSSIGIFSFQFSSMGRSSYARALIEVWADVELKDNIVVAMPKLVGEGFYTCTIHIEYEWKPPRRRYTGFVYEIKLQGFLIASVFHLMKA
nr:hypothetical protein [Tanacetum cinerariifolium]